MSLLETGSLAQGQSVSLIKKRSVVRFHSDPLKSAFLMTVAATDISELCSAIRTRSMVRLHGGPQLMSEKCYVCPRVFGCDPRHPLCPEGESGSDGDASLEAEQATEHRLKAGLDERLPAENQFGEDYQGAPGHPPCENFRGRKLPKRPR